MRTHLLIGAMVLVALSLPTWAANPLATFTAKEWLGVDWPRTLVTYRVTFPPGQAKPGMVRLVDAAGAEVPVQLSRVTRRRGELASAWVTFYAELQKNGSYAYRLLPERPAAAKPVAVETRTDGLTLDNGHVAVRLPAPGAVTYATPRRLEATDAGDGGAAAVPGPLQGVRLLSGAWTAPSYFWAADPATAPLVTGYRCELTDAGPLFAAARITYSFTNGGTYALTVRLLREEANVRLDEQCDLHTIRAARDWRVVFPLTDAAATFRPDAAWWATSEGRLGGADAAVETAAGQAGFAPLPGNRRHLGSMTFQPQAPKTRLLGMAVWYPYAPNAYYLGLTEKARLTAPKTAIPFAGVMPMHAGNWRGMAESSNGDVLAYAGGRAAVAWPLTVSPHPNSLLHTGEYDPDLPYTTLRRQWAFLAGPMQYQGELQAFRRYEGYVSLDDYKDWVLDWPADPTVTYPRTVTDRAHVDAWAAKLDAHPLGAQLKGLLAFTDDESKAKALFAQLASDSYWSGARGHALRCLGRDNESLGSTGWVAGFRHSQKAAWTNAADEALASRYLTPEGRTQLRAWIAACCYALTEPDFNPRGMMAHLGNPNMPMNRFFALTFAAALIPDHPQAKTWLATSRDYLRYKLAMNTAPGGGWSELLTYYMSAASHCMQAAMVLDSQGLLDDQTAKLAAQVGSFPLDLLSPIDPRFGTRCLPAWGHEGYWMIPTQWLPVAAFTRVRDPHLARDLVWAWDRLGRPQEDHHDAGFSPRTIIHADLLNVVPKDYVPARLRSKWIPGFGATMRAHVGDPNETYFSYRQGYMVSHCDANQGDFILYSKGAPLTTASLFQYAIYNNSPFQKLYESFGWHNRVRFGAQTNTGGWPGGGPISQVHRFFSSDSADYLRGEGDYAPQRWTRQILFLKGKRADGPNYFLFRDSFSQLGEAPLEPKWWYFKSGGETTRIAPNPAGLVYTTPWGPKLDIHFLQPTAVTTESRQATSRGPLYNRAALLWQKQGHPLPGGQTDETMTVTAAGPIPAGQDILVALYPQGKDETAPRYERVAEGVAKITTGEGTDYVFMSRTPMAYRDAEITFRGLAGAVRVYAEDVHLIIAEGAGEVSYRGMTVKSPVPVTKLFSRRDPEVGVWSPTLAPPPEFAPLRPRDTTVTAMGPGITKLTSKGSITWQFATDTPVDFTREGVHFQGRRGSITVDEQKRVVTLTLQEGTRIAYGELVAWGCDGPYTVTFAQDRIVGQTWGLGRFLYLTRPAGLDRLPTLTVDGQTYAPGTSGDFALGDIAKTGNPYDAKGRGGLLIVPVLPGAHHFTLSALSQPPIFRNWQAGE
jgi:hypothetical protein